MLIAQFLLVNTHFVLSLLAALAVFAIFWLDFDAWTTTKEFKTSFVFLGFLLLSFSFIAQAVIIDQSLLQNSILGIEIPTLTKAFFRVTGYLSLIIGQIAVPLQLLPSYRKQKPKFKKLLPKPPIQTQAIALVFMGIPAIQLNSLIFPLLAAIVAFLYLNRATTGLEHHLKPIALGFFVLAFHEFLGLASIFRGTDNITLLKIVAPFGPLWLTEHLILLITAFIFGKWVWGYLLKRFENQLFIILTTITLSIFLLTTIIFTFATLRNLKQDILNNLKTNVSVLAYTIDSKKAEILSDAQMLANNTTVVSAVQESDKATLSPLAIDSLLTKKQSSLIIVSAEGAVLARGEDPERTNDSLSDNPLVVSALENKKSTTITTKEGVLAPIVSVKAAVPISADNEVIGAVIISSDIDNSFVDGIKQATNLNASIYADNIRSATTFISADNKSRWVGIAEENSQVKQTVLQDGNTFAGTINLLNVPYFVAYSPLKNIDSNPVGMLFVGQPQISILQTASRSLELTFLTTAILIILSILPAYSISQYILKQIR